MHPSFAMYLFIYGKNQAENRTGKHFPWYAVAGSVGLAQGLVLCNKYFKAFLMILGMWVWDILIYRILYFEPPKWNLHS